LARSGRQEGHTIQTEVANALTIEIRPASRGLSLVLSGRLDSASIGEAWDHVIGDVATRRPAELVIDATKLDYCDGAGAALLLHLKAQQSARNATFGITGASEQITSLIALYDVSSNPSPAPAPEPLSLAEQVGKTTLQGIAELRNLLDFYGQTIDAISALVVTPRRVRWRDAIGIAAIVGVDAVPLISILGCLSCANSGR